MAAVWAVGLMACLCYSSLGRPFLARRRYLATEGGGVGDHWIVSGGRGCMAAAGLGVCVAPCLQTFQTKPDTSAARGRLCGHDAGVWRMPWL